MTSNTFILLKGIFKRKLCVEREAELPAADAACVNNNSICDADAVHR